VAVAVELVLQVQDKMEALVRLLQLQELRLLMLEAQGHLVVQVAQEVGVTEVIQMEQLAPQILEVGVEDLFQELELLEDLV
jgi:hypothetical protein